MALGGRRYFQVAPKPPVPMTRARGGESDGCVRSGPASTTTRPPYDAPATAGDFMYGVAKVEQKDVDIEALSAQFEKERALRMKARGQGKRLSELSRRSSLPHQQELTLQ